MQGVLLTVYRIKKLKKAAKVQQKDCRAIDREKNQENKLRSLSPHANYIDRATAACRRI
jgi:hypothetical protein